MGNSGAKTALQKVSLAVNIVYIAVCIYSCVKYVVAGRWMMVPLGLAGALFLLINPVAERLFRIKLGDSLGVVLKLFYLFAYVLGTGLRWYEKLPQMDKIMHLFSGVIFGLIGFCLFRRFDYGETPRGSKRALQVFFALGISMLVASVWEIYEFLAFLISGHDAQHHLTTGVFDTMGDIISCFLGTAVMCADYLICVNSKKGVTLPLTRLLETFDSSNDFSRKT